MSKAAKSVTASVAVIAFAAATAFGSFALAQDGFGGPDADDQAAAQQNNNVTWDQQADGTVNKVPTPADNGSATQNGESTPANGTDAANGQPNASDNGAQVVQNDANTQTAQQQPAPAAAAGCDNVQDWAALGGCVAQSGTVTITKTIDAASSGPLTIPAGVDITLTAVAGLDPALTAATGDGLFIVNGTLTIGADTNDANFSYKNGKRWLALVQNGGKLTVNNGTFSGVDTTGTDYANGGIARMVAGASAVINNGMFTNNKASNGGVIYATAGQVVINNGTFSNNTAEVAGVLSMYDAATATVAGGTFSKNVATKAGEWNGGGVIRMMGNSALTITGGTFGENSTNGEGGGVVYGNGKGITVTGGSFEGNKSFGAGGGAILQKSESTLTVAPADGQEVTFTNNGQTFADDVLKQCIANSSRGGSGAVDGCHAGTGGGAIAGFAGKVNIDGNVTFDGNYSNAWGYMIGGGAIYMKGELWVQNDAKGNKPKFVNNYAGVGQPEIVDGKVTTVLRGGAGGAIFLNNGTVTGTGDDRVYTSKAYIMGGDFENNASGYLGGAIYTESESLTYVAKAVAYSNTAGHFGGGLWLCPSGTGTASKGGNIALFDNTVNKGIDPDQANGTVT